MKNERIRGRRLLAAIFALGLFTAAGVAESAPPAAHEEPQGPQATKKAETNPCPPEQRPGMVSQEFSGLVNPLPVTPQNLLAGKTLFHFDAAPHPCFVCHGVSGKGLGTLFDHLEIKPPNFFCARALENVPDGQLFEIIKKGSPDKSMPAFPSLEDDQIWQLILYMRHFADAEAR